MDGCLDRQQIWRTFPLTWDDVWPLLCMSNSGSRFEVDRFSWARSFLDTSKILLLVGAEGILIGVCSDRISSDINLALYHAEYSG